VKYSEFIRLLSSHGVTFQKGKGSHLKAFYQSRQTAVPNHGSKEIGEGLRKDILKQLGITQRKK
jgi:mRNA interferase HicA